MQLILSEFCRIAIDVTIQQAHAYFDPKLTSSISIDLDTSSSNPAQPDSSEKSSSSFWSRFQVKVYCFCFYGVPGIRPMANTN